MLSNIAFLKKSVLPPIELNVVLPPMLNVGPGKALLMLNVCSVGKENIAPP